MRAIPQLLVVAMIGCTGSGTGVEGSGESSTQGSSSTPSTTDTGLDGTGSGTTAAVTTATTTTTTNADSTTSRGSTTDGTIFDVGGNSESGVEVCGDGGGGGMVDFAYAWVANSCLNNGVPCPNSAVSKIDTTNIVEVARYRTRPDGDGNPSRTSVNLNGDVAVANRKGGITMIRARLEDCPDPSYTSSGPGDVKDWQDGCIAWHTPMDYFSQRPIAWTQGTLNEVTCRYENAMVWTSGTTAGGQVEVLLLDGETGVVTETVPLVGLSTGFLGFGLYGGAVDGEGNFWASQLGDASGGTPPGSLIRVRLSDFQYDSWPSPIPAYGMTVDGFGRPWLCAAQTARFDPATELFDVGEGQPDGGSGCMEDGLGRLWIAGRAITAVDLETMDVLMQYDVPVLGGDIDTGYTRGISIDDQGYVWAPAHWANRAYRLDPDSGEFEFVDGLVFPYTYSDMTGFALSNAGVPAG